MGLSKGLIQVYTGDGKGKTTAALGQALRSVGHGLSILFVQFVKGNSFTGEIFSTKYLTNFILWQFGRDCKFSSAIRDNIISCIECGECFIGKEGPTDLDREILAKGWEKVKKEIYNQKFDIVILDEITLAIHFKLIPLKEVIEVLKNKPSSIEIILTGRNMPEEILSIANLITEMKEIKHPFKEGISARWGIEY
ncbi:MAG: cob(I)yrinic acid a,c-diamide adenosyltransferase [Dictyoglomaceae bacterium]|nr:cob(I)yrinic acid a,c-diamide adenosyltransferase [Dictyoglomaceae bacterium]